MRSWIPWMTNRWKKINEHRSPLDLEECPEGHPYCTGDCFYYSEDPEERIAKGEEHWDLE